MEYSDKCNLFFKLVDKVDFFWNFRYLSSSVVFFLLITHDIVVDVLFFKILATVLYLFVVFGVLSAHLRAYGFLNEMLKEINVEVDNHFNNKEICNSLKKTVLQKKYVHKYSI